jgi:hypothetical protein
VEPLKPSTGSHHTASSKLTRTRGSSSQGGAREYLRRLGIDDDAEDEVVAKRDAHVDWTTREKLPYVRRSEIVGAPERTAPNSPSPSTVRGMCAMEKMQSTSPGAPGTKARSRMASGMGLK